MELSFSKEVLKAKADGRAIVALESTIITHGMPYPQNLETAQAVKTVVRDAGAIPATIAVIDGQVHIGLEDTQLEHLAKTSDAQKLSRADLAACIAMSGTGSTTVAATMILAHLGGIDVFATGGIGGVHRGAELTFDVSADLQELAETPVTVVCAGAKAILDIPKTLEMLETLGVPVITYGTSGFPAFWSCESGHKSPLSMKTAAQIAKAHRTKADIGLKGGQLIANPIPKEAELSRAYLEPLITQATKEAEGANISSKKVTPFLLSRIFELTDGASLTANIALIKNNAKLASEIAIALTNAKDCI